ncbi:MAG: DMT family transporter [Patescibacteria group bacterium]
MGWISFAISAVFLNSLSTILQKNHASKKINHTVITGSLYSMVSGAVVLIFAYITAQGAIVYTSKSLVLTLIALSIFVIGNWAYFRAMYILNASVLTIVMTLRALITTVIAWIFLNEGAHTNQYVGMALILTAILISQNIKKLKLNIEGVIFAVVAAFAFGIGNVFERIIVKEMNLYLYLVPAYLVPAVIVFLVQQWRLNGRPIRLSKITAGHVVFVGFISALSGILGLQSLALAPSSGHYAFVNQTRVIFVAVMAYFFLHEKGDIKRRLFAAFLSALGLLLLS